MSNQVYTEAYTCPAARRHPKSNHFILQTNGNYIAKFSASSPYKMNKHQRFDGGHQVAGYHINCNFNREVRTTAKGEKNSSLSSPSLSPSLRLSLDVFLPYISSVL